MLLAVAAAAGRFALAWAAVRRGVPGVAVAGVAGSVAGDFTAWLGVAALAWPLAVGGLLAPRDCRGCSAGRLAGGRPRRPAEPAGGGRAGDRLRGVGDRRPVPLTRFASGDR